MRIRFNADKVRKYLHNIDKSGADFAYDADIKYETFKNAMRGDFMPKLDTAYKLANQMKCSIEDLIIKD